jgi:hypothetical protein
VGCQHGGLLVTLTREDFMGQEHKSVCIGFRNECDKRNRFFLGLDSTYELKHDVCLSELGVSHTT